jgi:VacB/RNase II family 3'-5' exoribonuclease
MSTNERHHRTLLEQIAHRAMLERGLLPDFSEAALIELGKISKPSTINAEAAKDPGMIQDLRHLLWASIDNDDSRDLDQLSVAERMPGDNLKIFVAVADVDSLVKRSSAIDDHARHNTTSVYTAAKIFPMLPEKLSTNLTSLNFDEERLSIVIDMMVGSNGSILSSDVYQALVRNHAQLAYNSVADWLDGNGAIPKKIADVQGLAENLRLQDKAAQKMKDFRHTHGALNLETIESKPRFDGDQIRDLEVEEKNRAKQIVEDFMIAANGVIACYLSSKKSPSIRRVVRTPKRWDRIVELARDRGFRLPDEPNSKALDEFLIKEKTADLLRFPDLCLAVIKLMGAGEYMAEGPDDTPPGHFGLAINDYTHATAPNRRYPDLITQRLLKSALTNKSSLYSMEELDILAQHCTLAEDSAKKVERQVNKSAAALLLESRIGEQFDALVTGASSKGTWVRLLRIPVEGKLVHGFDGLDVGDRVHVQLISIDVERGFIDFEKAGRPRH